MPRLRRPTPAVPILLVGVLLQIAYPLAHGSVRAHLAVAVVVVLAAGCVAHAATSRSVPVALAVLVVTAGLGFAVEALGVHTGVPFGHYRYTGVLGTRAFGVPLVVGPAWTMLAWPSALAARRLVADPVARVVVGAWALAAADVFLDPQLVALGAWRWADPSPHLPGVTTVPLTNYLGWLGTALVLSAVLQSFVGDGRGPDAPALALYLWLWIGWTVAQLAFLDLRPSAGWGFLAMGLVAVPLTRRLRI